MRLPLNVVVAIGTVLQKQLSQYFIQNLYLYPDSSKQNSSGIDEYLLIFFYFELKYAHCVVWTLAKRHGR